MGRRWVGTVRKAPRREREAVLRGTTAHWRVWAGLRKRAGSASASTGAQWRAALSHERIRIRPYEDPVRERTQSPRVTANMFARATNRPNLHVSSLPRMSRRRATASWLRTENPGCVRQALGVRDVVSDQGEQTEAGRREAPSVQQERRAAFPFRDGSPGSRWPQHNNCGGRRRMRLPSGRRDSLRSVDGLAELLPRLERRCLRGGDGDALAGGRIASLSGGAITGG